MQKLRYLTTAIQIICATLMGVVTVVTFAQVIRRHVLGDAWRWPAELAIFSMVWITFLGAVLCLKDKEHTRIDFFINLLPAKVKKWIEVLGLVVCFTFMMMLAAYSPGLLTTTGTFVSVGLGIPMYIVYGSIITSAILMIPYFFILIAEKIREDVAVVAETQEAAEEIQEAAEEEAARGKAAGEDAEIKSEAKGGDTDADGR